MLPSSAKQTWLALLLPLALAIGCSPHLEPGEEKAASIREGEHKSVSFDLKAGHFTHIVVEQESADILLTLRDPDGEPIGFEVDAEAPPRPEHLYYIPKADGRYKIDIEGLSVTPTAGKNGKYSIRFEKMRQATAQDRLINEASWIEAEALFYKAVEEDYVRAVDLFSPAIDLWLRAERKPEALSLYLEKSISQYRLGQAFLSRQSALEAYKLAQEIGDPSRITRSLTTAGTASRLLGWYQEALEFQRQALDIAISQGEQEMIASTSNNLCVLYGEIGRLEQARDSCQEALVIHEANDYPTSPINALSNLATAHYRLGDWQGAIDLYARALQLDKPHQDSLRSKLLSNYARTLAAGGRFNHAHEMYLQSLALREQIGDQRGIVHVRSAIARLLVKQDKTKEALDQLELALEVHKNIDNDANTRLTVMSSAAIVYQDSGDLDSALEMADSAYRQLEASRREPSDFVDRATFLDSKWSALDLRVALRMQKFEQSLDTAWQFKALHAAEETRARTLVDRFSESSAPSNASLLTPQEIQEEILDSETALIQFHLGESRSFLWTLTKNGIHSSVLAPGEKINRQAEELYELLVAREIRLDEETNEERGRRIAESDRLLPLKTQALARELDLSSLLNHPEIRRWLVVADGALNRIPLGMLSLDASIGASLGRPLLADFELVSLPSASVLAALRDISPAKATTQSVAIFADPVFQADDPRNPDVSRIARLETPLTRLPLSGDEARALAKMAPGNVELHLGHAASKENLLSPSLKSVRNLHFATHGSLSGGRSPQASLVMSLFDANGEAIEGQVSAKELYSLDLGAELVVLSACRTARGRELRGEGLIGLSTGFMYAGVPRVVASQWAVQDGIARSLMIDFYDRVWRQGMRPAAALREAQLELWREGLSSYYWASFVFQGDWR